MTSPVITTKTALKDFISAACPTAQVTYGPPGTITNQDIIALGQVDVVVARNVMGSHRHRDHEITVELIISSFRMGADDEPQIAATEAALGYLDAIDKALRSSAQENFNVPGVLAAPGRISKYSLDDSSDPDIMEQGRVSTISASITLTVRA